MYAQPGNCTFTRNTAMTYNFLIQQYADTRTYQKKTHKGKIPTFTESSMRTASLDPKGRAKNYSKRSSEILHENF